jgi:hypothetical protein
VPAQSEPARTPPRPQPKIERADWRDVLARYKELEALATTVAASGIYALKDPKAVLTVMLIAIDEGSSLFEAVGDYYIIKGSVGVYSKCLLRRFQERGGEAKWLKDGSDGEAELWAKAHYLPGQPELSYKYTREMADAGHLTMFWNKDPNEWRTDPKTKKREKGTGWSLKQTWESYEPALLRARVTSGLFTMLAPDVFRGRKTVDQIEDSQEAEYEILPENGKTAIPGPTLTGPRDTPAPTDTKPEPEPEPEKQPEAPPPPEQRPQLTFNIGDV